MKLQLIIFAAHIRCLRIREHRQCELEIEVRWRKMHFSRATIGIIQHRVEFLGSLAGFSIFTHDRRINLARSGSNRVSREPCVALRRGIRWLKSDRRHGDHADLVGALNSNFPFYRLLVIVIAATSPVTYASLNCLPLPSSYRQTRLRVERARRPSRPLRG